MALSIGCGGGMPAPDDAGDMDMPDGDAAPGDAAPADAAPSDGIMRDADGDGEADQDVSTCKDLDETKCKISSDCAWTDAGICDDAKGSPM
jgi:hypothetical protein